MADRVFFKVNDLEFPMLYIPAGTHLISSEGLGASGIIIDNYLKHSGFYISEERVSVQMWKSIMGEEPASRIVFKADCQTFIDKLNALTGLNYSMLSENKCVAATKHLRVSEYHFTVGDVPFYIANQGDYATGLFLVLTDDTYTEEEIEDNPLETMGSSAPPVVQQTYRKPQPKSKPEPTPTSENGELTPGGQINLRSGFIFFPKDIPSEVFIPCMLIKQERNTIERDFRDQACENFLHFSLPHLESISKTTNAEYAGKVKRYVAANVMEMALFGSFSVSHPYHENSLEIIEITHKKLFGVVAELKKNNLYNFPDDKFIEKVKAELAHQYDFYLWYQHGITFDQYLDKLNGLPTPEPNFDTPPCPQPRRHGDPKEPRQKRKNDFAPDPGQGWTFETNFPKQSILQKIKNFFGK